MTSIVSLENYPWVYLDEAGVLKGVVTPRGELIPFGDSLISTTFLQLQIDALAAKPDPRLNDLQGELSATNVLMPGGVSVVSAILALQAAQAGFVPGDPAVTSGPVLGGIGNAVGDVLTWTSGAISNGSGGAPTSYYTVYRAKIGVAPEPIFGFQNITGTSYTRAAPDIGFFLYVVQQAIDPVTGRPSVAVPSTTITAVVTGTAPTNSVAPSFVLASPQASTVPLVAVPGTWSVANCTFGYLFFDNGTPVGSRSSNDTFPNGTQYVGHTITVNVIATTPLGVSSATAVAASNSVVITGANVVVNTVQPDVDGDVAGAVYKGFYYLITPGTWTLNGTATTPTSRVWEFYQDNVPYNGPPNTEPSVTIDALMIVGQILNIVERVTIAGVEYTSSLSSATDYTVTTAPSTLTVQVNTASSTFTVGFAIQPYQPVGATGGTPPYSYAVNPSLSGVGLSINQSTGDISGTPTVAGSTPFTITITDSAGTPAQVSGQTTIILQSSSITEVTYVRADLPFSGQGGNVQHGGSGSTQISVVSDAIGGGITGVGLINGSTVRFGKVTLSGRTIIKSAVSSSDEGWFGGPQRTDVQNGGSNSFVQGDIVWVAVEQMCPTGFWNTPNIITASFSSHGATDGGWGGKYSLNEGAFMFQIIRNSSTPPPAGYTDYFFGPGGIPRPGGGSWVTADTFHKFVVKVLNHATAGLARTQLWIDGVLAVDTTEANAAGNTFPCYIKAPTCYTVGNTHSGLIYTRSAHVIKDNSSQYTEPQIRALLV